LGGLISDYGLGGKESKLRNTLGSGRQELPVLSLALINTFYGSQMDVHNLNFYLVVVPTASLSEPPRRPVKDFFDETSCKINGM